MMRARIGLLALLGLFCSTAPLAAAEGPAPPGSYLYSCRDARVANGMILAFCRNQAGVFQPAAMAAIQCGGNDIVNNNGTLGCGGPRPGGGRGGQGWGGPPPPPPPNWGGYGPGYGPGWGSPGRGGGPPPPRGSYLASCRNINVAGDTLNALCQNAGGGWMSTSIDLDRCYGRDISNRNGRLTCR